MGDRASPRSDAAAAGAPLPSPTATPAERDNHWGRYHRLWQRLGPPLRPPPEVVEALQRAIAERAPCALLGVTPELAGIGAELTAIDRDPQMIAALWPGDTTTRRAVIGDWLDFPAALTGLGAVIGDGSLNVLPNAGAHTALMLELRRVLAPGGRAAVRVFVRPLAAETTSAVLQTAALSESFHGFKWRLAMAICADSGAASVPVREILRVFRQHIPDPQGWMKRLGWPGQALATIEVYESSLEVYSFPTRQELEASVPSGLHLSWRDVAGYELAERCPLAVLDKP